MRSKYLLSILALGIGALASGPALADTNHGVACKTNHGEAHLVGYNSNGVFNNSTSPARVICPGSKSSNTFSSNELRVTLVDPSPTADATCRVNMLNEAGKLVYSQGFSTSSFSGSPMIVKTSLPGDAGFIEIECTLPAQTGPAAFHLMNYTITP